MSEKCVQDDNTTEDVRWFSLPQDLPVGTVRFLIKTEYQFRDRPVYEMSREPARTNSSGEPKLSGWCGETNNTNVTACGLWRVVGHRGEFMRGLVRLTGEERDAWLCENEFEELIP